MAGDSRFCTLCLGTTSGEALSQDYKKPTLQMPLSCAPGEASGTGRKRPKGLEMLDYGTVWLHAEWEMDYIWDYSLCVCVFFLLFLAGGRGVGGQKGLHMVWLELYEIGKDLALWPNVWQI